MTCAREPMLDAATGELRAAEYLWRPPLGLGRALALLRTVDLSSVLTVVLARQALGGDDPMVSVNVDADLLTPELVVNLLAVCTPPPGKLILEVVETRELHPAWPRAVERLTGAGVLLAVDDAGCGLSDGDRIRALRPAVVKLDRSVLSATPARVSPLLAAARDVGATVVAEGVESERLLTRARDLGADWVQGYLFA